MTVKRIRDGNLGVSSSYFSREKYKSVIITGNKRETIVGHDRKLVFATAAFTGWLSREINPDTNDIHQQRCRVFML